MSQPPASLLLAMAAILASGCSASPEATRTFVFDCPDGTRLSASFTGDTLHLELPEGTALLPSAVSASGARYASDTLEFWEHQGSARVSRYGEVVYEECSRQEDGTG